MDPPSNPNEDKMTPFFGRTFTNDENQSITAGKLTMWDLINQLRDPLFQNLVKNEVDKIAQKSIYPLKAHQLKTKDHIFPQIVNEMLESIHKVPSFTEKEDNYIPLIIKWIIDYDRPIIALASYPDFDENLEFSYYDCVGNYESMKFHGIPSQNDLDELGEAGIIAAMIIGFGKLPKPIKTLQEIIMDTFVTERFSDEELLFHLSNDPSEKFKEFVFGKMEGIPEFVHQNSYFKRQLPEEWQKILWNQYDDNYGFVAVYPDFDTIGTRSCYTIIEGICYTEWTEYEGGKTITFKYDNNLQIIEEIVEIKETEEKEMPGGCRTLFQLFQLGVNPEDLNVLPSDLPLINNKNDRFKLAALLDDFKIIEELLSDPEIDPNANNNQILRILMHKKHFKSLKILLKDPRIDPSYDDNVAIIETIHSDYPDHLEILELLLRNKHVNPSVPDNDILCFTCMFGYVQIVKLLLEDPRVNPGDQNSSAICQAALDGNIEIVELLLGDPRVDPSDQNNEALDCAVRRGHIVVVKILLSDPRVKSSVTDELLASALDLEKKLS